MLTTVPKKRIGALAWSLPRVNWAVMGLLAVTVFAGALRLYRLGEWSFWVDETLTVRDSVDLSRLSLNHPLWYVVTHGAIKWLGASEWSARLPAALIGIASIPLLYLALRRAGQEHIGLAAALLLAVSPWHLYWSQNARFYIIVALLTGLALIYFYTALEEDKPLLLLTSLLLFGAGMLAHQSALLPLLAAGAYLMLLIGIRHLRPVGVNRRNLQILAGLSVLGGTLVAVPIIKRPDQFLQFLSWVNNDPFWLVSVVGYYLGPPVICMAILGAVAGLIKRDRFAILLVLAALVPLVTIMVVSMFSYAASRYTFAIAIPWILLAARGGMLLVSALPPANKWLGFGVIGLLVVSSLSEDVMYFQYQNGNRSDIRGAYDYVERRRAAGDYVYANKPALGAYYLEGTRVVPVTRLDPASLEQEGRRAWVVTDLPPSRLRPDLAQWIAKRTTLVSNLDVHAPGRTFVSRVYLFDPARQPIAAGTP